MPHPIDLEQLSAEFLETYELQRKIATGGMGEVWLARERELERHVAIKFLHQRLFSLTAARFKEEARAHAGLSHQNIVTLITFGGLATVPYIVFEYIDGPSLSRYLADHGPLPVDQVLDWSQQLARGMAHAHGQGVLHRDLKPMNILVTGDLQLKVTDFGLARRQEREEALTKTGELMGSPSTMAPEQALGHKCVFQTDVYSVGIIIYQMLTGRAPFDRTTVPETLMAHVHAPVPNPRDERGDIPSGLAEVVKLCLAKSPFDRPANFRALEQLLDMCATGRFEQAADTRPPGG